MGLKLRWGILGPGRIAPRIVRALAAHPRSELVAVASRDAGRADAFGDAHDVARRHAAYEALLRDPDVDVVYIALPNHLHVPWTIAALEAGKHVLCEKPIALRPEAVDAITAAASRAGRIAVEGFMYLHHPQVAAAVDLARRGDLGELRLMRGSFSFPLSHPGDPRVEPSMGGGSLWDVGCYPVTFARRLAGDTPAGGDPIDVAAFARFDERGVDWTFAGQLRFPSGLLAQFDSSFAEPDRQRIELIGQDALLVLDAPFLSAPDGPPPRLTVWRDGEPADVPVPTVDQVRLEVDDLTAAILDGTEPRVPIQFSRGTVAALAALDASARAAANVAPLPVD